MAREYDMERRNVMYVKKTAIPIWGGALLIIAGLLNILGGVGLSIGGAVLDDLYGFVGTVFAGIPLIIVGAITLAGGIVAVMRRLWWLAIVGGILAVLPSPGWLFGVAGLILVSIAKPEFDYREVLVEGEEREPRRMRVIRPIRATEPAGETEPVRSTAPGINTMLVQTYLRGLDYPANKNEINIFAKSNGAPDMVMTYMNRLPNREYQNSADIEEEFSKIR